MKYSVDELCKLNGYSPNLHYAEGELYYDAIGGTFEDNNGNIIRILVFLDKETGKITVDEVEFRPAPRYCIKIDMVKNPHRLQEMIQDAARASCFIDSLKLSVNWQAEFDRMAAEDAA